jgi:hypothetical protein
MYRVARPRSTWSDDVLREPADRAIGENWMRKRQSYINKYPDDGEALYRLLQREAALAAAVARKKKSMNRRRAPQGLPPIP